MSFPYGAWPHHLCIVSLEIESELNGPIPFYILIHRYFFPSIFFISSTIVVRMVERVKVIYRDDDVSIREMDVVDIVI